MAIYLGMRNGSRWRSRLLPLLVATLVLGGITTACDEEEEPDEYDLCDPAAPDCPDGTMCRPTGVDEGRCLPSCDPSASDPCGDGYARANRYPAPDPHPVASNRYSSSTDPYRAASTPVPMAGSGGWHFRQLCTDPGHGPFAGQEWRDCRRHLGALLGGWLGGSLDTVNLGRG